MKTLFLVLFMAFEFTVPQSIDSLINEALQNNVKMKSYKYKDESVLLRAKQKSYLPPPTLGIEFSQVPLKKVDLINEPLSQNLSFSQMFMLGGKLNAMYEAEKLNSDLTKNEFNTYAITLIKKIKNSYYDSWKMEYDIDLKKENLKILNKLLESTLQKYSIGKASYSELLLLKADIASTEVEIKKMENDLKTEYYMLNYFLGRDHNNDDITIRHKLIIDSTDYNDENIVNIVLDKNPDLKRMDIMKNMNNLEIESNKKEIYPDLMIQGMLMRMPKGMILTSKSSPMDLGMGKTEYMYSIMASITLPFAPWSSGKIKDKENELVLLNKSIDYEKQDMLSEMITDIKAKTNELNIVKTQINLIESDVIPSYKNVINIQTTEFLNNSLPLNNILQTINMMLMKEEELAELKTKHQQLLSEIDSILGKNL